MKKILILGVLIATLFLTACKKDDSVFCTMDFRTVSIEVQGGDPLSRFFTIRMQTGDTITHEDLGVFENFYPVLTDNFQKVLENRSESFRFLGFVNDSLVVNELFVIGADRCHIEKISGKSKIEL